MRIIIFVITLLCFFPLVAQEDTTNNPKDLEDEKVVIVSAYTPQLAKAEKVLVSPSSSDIPSTKDSGNSNGLQNVNPYDLTPNFLELELEAPEFRPVALPKDDSGTNYLNEDNYYFWLKAGFGNYRTPLLNISANTADRIENGVYGIDLDHISSNAGDAKAFMRNSALVFGEHKTDKFRTDAEVSYDFDRYHYYGFNKDTFEFKSEDIRIHFQNIATSLQFDNRHQSLTNYEFAAGVNANYLFTNLAAKELTSDFNTALYRRWQSGLKIGGEALISYTNNTDSLTQGSDRFENMTVSLVPKASYKWSWGRAELGASALFDNTKFIAYPNTYVQIDAVRNVLGFYGGLEKKIKKNNLKTLSDENPFLNHTIDYDNSIIESRYVGIKSNISSFAALDVRGLWEITENQPLFVNEISDIFEDDKEFIVIYEPRMETMGVEAELSFFVNKITQLSAKVSYRDFDLEQEETAWLLPAFSTELKFLIKPLPQLQLESDFFWYGERFAYNPTKEASVRRNPIFDINVSAKYSFTENLGAFLNVNNLALSKYQRFLYYPSYGLNFVGGITARF